MAVIGSTPGVIAFADLQGCFIPDSGDFILKEFALIAPGAIIHRLVLPQLGFAHLSDVAKRQYYWVRNNHHGLRWDSGSITIDDLTSSIGPLLANVNVVYVKGDQKCEWMRNILPQNQHRSIIVADITQLGCEESLRGCYTNQSKLAHVFHTTRLLLDAACKEVKHHQVCALQNAIRIHMWHSTNFPIQSEELNSSKYVVNNNRRRPQQASTAPGALPK